MIDNCEENVDDASALPSLPSGADDRPNVVG
jgi:hypothetical protein